MGTRLKALASSLGIRLLIPLFLVVGAVLAIHALVSFRSTQEHFLELMGDEAYRASGLIRRATHDGMLLNRLGEVQATIERLAEGSDVWAIRVYDKEGAIVLSSRPAEIGHRIPTGDPPCSECHEGGTLARPAAVEAAGIIESGDGEVLRQLSLIENEPACSSGGCHDGSADEAVLGVLDVEMSMRPLESHLASARGQLARTSLLMMLVIGLVASVMFRHLVQRPVRRLREGTRRVAEGDLDTRIEVGGRHDLAFLARDFNQMARDLRESQRQVTEWSHRLEDKVVEKTAELRSAQRQVLHMEKMASLGKLSATVAHELNNPLSGILTYARLVERELDEQSLEAGVAEEIDRYLHLMQRECGRCGEIVRNLLVFARRTGTEPSETDLREVVERGLMLVRHLTEMKGVRMETRFPDGESRLLADPGQLQQALVALFVNAVEAMDEGGELRVEVEGDADELRVAIADTGSGIPADVLPQIFEPFFTTKERESGAGLGLAVVYGIVHRHGGSIHVDSTPGRGTTFHLRLPRTPPGGEAAEEEGRETGSRPGGGGGASREPGGVDGGAGGRPVHPGAAGRAAGGESEVPAGSDTQA